MTEWLKNIVSRAAVAASDGLPELPGTSYLLDGCRGAARSVLVLTVPYRVPGAGDGNLAAFAALPDYHRSFAAFFADLRDELGDGFLAGFADHSPYAEVALAARAGLGVRGDNGLLLTADYGSYVFIGEAVLSLPPRAASERLGVPEVRLTAEIPACGHCGACAAACPGTCLPGTDRSSCLSAVSQQKSELTEEQAAAVASAGWAWGCDGCQTVCPWNRAAGFAGRNRFTEPVRPGITVAEAEAMTKEEYAARAFGWRPKRVLVRNLTLQEGGRRRD